MAINYTRLAATAERLVRENGRDVTLRKRNDTPPDPNQPWLPSASDTTTVVKAVIAPIEEDDRQEERMRDVVAQAIVAQNAAPGIDIETYSDLIDGVAPITSAMRVYRIKKAELIKPGPTRVCYIFLLTH